MFTTRKTKLIMADDIKAGDILAVPTNNESPTVTMATVQEVTHHPYPEQPSGPREITIAYTYSYGLKVKPVREVKITVPFTEFFTRVGHTRSKTN